MKNSVIAIQFCVITTILYTLLAPIYFEIDNAHGESEYFVDDNNNDKITMFSQQVVAAETECKSPCPSSAEICIAMCA